MDKFIRMSNFTKSNFFFHEKLLTFSALVLSPFNVHVLSALFRALIQLRFFVFMKMMEDIRALKIPSLPKQKKVTL